MGYEGWIKKITPLTKPPTHCPVCGQSLKEKREEIIARDEPEYDKYTGKKSNVHKVISRYCGPYEESKCLGLVKKETYHFYRRYEKNGRQWIRWAWSYGRID